MFSQLLGSRRFAPIFVCQFFSALNDNFIKMALVILILYRVGAEEGAVLVSLAGATLIAPFFFLSALGGEIADRFDKAQVARWIKVAEIPIAMLAAAGFALESVPMLFASLFGFGCMAALFGPIKYGILPDHLQTRELPAANALVEGATFLAILAGTIAGGLAMTSDGTAPIIPAIAVAGVVISFAVFGYISAAFIPPTGAAMPTLRITPNPLASTSRLLGELKADQRLWLGGLITSWFWLVGIVVLSLFPTLVKNVIGGSEEIATAGLATFTVGIALGSWLAAAASHRRPNLALVPLGALGMAAFAAYAAWSLGQFMPPANGAATIGVTEFLAMPVGLHLAFALLGLAASGGVFIVPAFAAVQAWAPANHRARTVAAVNILNALFMTAGTLGLASAQALGFGAASVLLTLAAANVAIALWVARVWGREALRDLAYALFKAVHRIEVRGREHLPAPGTRAIIVPNHVSFMDGPILHSLLPEHAAFAVDTGIAQASWVRPFLKFVDVFTLDPTKPLATRHLVKEVGSGRTLVIFPEGRLTTTGGLMKVYDGTAMIADKADAVVVPVRISGPERSPWSYLRRSQTKKVWFPKFTVDILPARKLEVDESLRGRARRQAAGRSLQDIMVETAVRTANLDRTVFDALCDAARDKDTGKPAVADPTGVSLSYRKLVIGAQALGAKIATMTEPGEAVGVMLPNAAGTAVTFFALQSAGRVPAMLNFTAGPANCRSACQTAMVRTVLTSRAFIERAHLEPIIAALSETVRIIYLDDLRTTISMGDKLRAAARGSRPLFPRKPEDAAAILFTSGSEGAPKAVVLSHRNLLANATQSLTIIAADGEDKVFNVLPVFHAFGLTAGLVMPLVGGVPVYLYPSPLHYRIVPELVYQTNATILFGTDTFLNGYARTAHPYDFHKLRLILAGAEAVKARTRALYMEKFGVRILEGYGVTETAPVLAINTLLANRSGTVGRLLPLLEARLEPITGIEGGGRLYVRGPNVMLGYYRAERPGVLEPPENGWHDTGDIVEIDSEGFVTIKGRAKRFAKIGGEMVSLAAVEALAIDIWPAGLSIAVALPDPRKGERIVLLTEHHGADRSTFLAEAKRRGAADLMLPAEVMTIDRVPLLGSGKPDAVTALKIVSERIAAARSTAPAAPHASVAGELAGSVS